MSVSYTIYNDNVPPAVADVPLDRLTVMRRAKVVGVALYTLFDYLAAVFTWTLFFSYRKVAVEGYAFSWDVLDTSKFYWGILIIPLGWLFLHFVSGSYSDIYRKSRMTELYRSLVTTFLGAVALFFLVLIDDVVTDQIGYQKLFGVLFGLQLLTTLTVRMVILTIANHRLRINALGYNTIIVGGNGKAVKLYQEITGRNRSLGYRFLGFIEANGKRSNNLEKLIPNLGTVEGLPQIIEKYHIDEVIIAIETSEHHRINDIINQLAEQKIIIKIIPDMYDILAGSVRMNNVLDAALIEIYPDLMPEWQRIIKRGIDIFASGIVLILLSPLYLFLAIKVRMSSPGPIFYSQQRVGRGGKPFTIYKFRSMYVDAEKYGPQLSSKHDYRITPWGRFMRKWRLDEIPQFYNVLRGDMSLVGPRPERRYYIDKIVAESPAYRHLMKVQPGVTSLGMVKFGYAENVEEMVERMQHDLLYIENMSLSLDFKVMIYTVLVLLQGRGK